MLSQYPSESEKISHFWTDTIYGRTLFTQSIALDIKFKYFKVKKIVPKNKLKEYWCQVKLKQAIIMPKLYPSENEIIFPILRKAKILILGIYRVFRGMKSEFDAEIGKNS